MLIFRCLKFSSVFDTVIFMQTQQVLEVKWGTSERLLTAWINSEFKISNASVLSIYRCIKVHFVPPLLLCVHFYLVRKFPLFFFLFNVISKTGFCFSFCVKAIGQLIRKERCSGCHLGLLSAWPGPSAQFPKWLKMQSSFGFHQFFVILSWGFFCCC